MKTIFIESPNLEKDIQNLKHGDIVTLSTNRLGFQAWDELTRLATIVMGITGRMPTCYDPSGKVM